MKSADLLVDLYQLTFDEPKLNVSIQRALSPDSDAILAFIQTYFSDGWVSEVKASLYKSQPTCYIAVDQKKLVGFACYDATAKSYFGPMGVHSDYRKKGIGKALILKCLEAMRYDGYGYAIIGSVESHNFHFYQEACQASPIEKSMNIYQRMIHHSNH